jgi:hypothetical protein
MPPKKDPESRHSKPAPHIRHKSKPKFEVPVETESPVAPVAWVYRTDDVPTPPLPAAPSPAAPSPAAPSPAAPSPAAPSPPAPSPAAPSPPAQRQTKVSSKSNPFLVAGMGLFLIGAATVGFVSLVALGLAAGPMGIGKGLLARDG